MNLLLGNHSSQVLLISSLVMLGSYGLIIGANMAAPADSVKTQNKHIHNEYVS